MCPNCREPLVVIELAGIELDRCVVCQGTWLDAGEIEQVVALAGVAPGQLSAALHAAGGGRRDRRRCPRCNRRMWVIDLGDQPRVPVDRCPRGHGLWFDRGEVQAVVRAFSGGEEGLVARFFSDVLSHDLSRDAKGGS